MDIYKKQVNCDKPWYEYLRREQKRKGKRMVEKHKEFGYRIGRQFQDLRLLLQGFSLTIERKTWFKAEDIRTGYILTDVERMSKKTSMAKAGEVEGTTLLMLLKKLMTEQEKLLTTKLVENK